MTPRPDHSRRHGRSDDHHRSRPAPSATPSSANPSSIEQLARRVRELDGSGYGGYKRLIGSYDLGPARLIIDRTQVDPYAPPSLMRLVVDRADAGFPDSLLDDRPGRIAAADFLIRAIAVILQDRTLPGASSARAVRIGSIGQQVLERTNVAITETAIEARLTVSLPANGRRIRGREAAVILTELLPALAERTLHHSALDAHALSDHVALLRDQEHVRTDLRERGLVAIVGDGAILPRRSGDSDLPMREGAVPFAAPDSLRTRIPLPSGGELVGMGIAEGITVIVGGGYHGKSTLLRAIERGVYPHIAEDGREWVITRGDAVSIRAEDGRSVTDVDISPFIANLPSGADTRHFSTTNASGSTSQAANLVEAVETGTCALLIDEDTSATNFMIRDARMRELIPADAEPITPFVDRVRPLRDDLGVSTVLVAGGSGAFFDAADRVIAMDSYVPQDVTEKAARIAQQHPDADPSAPITLEAPRPRIPVDHTLDPSRRRKPASARGRDAIRVGDSTIDVDALAQLIEPAQTDGIAHALDRLGEEFDGRISLMDAITVLDRRVDAEGLDALSPFRGHPGQWARPRGQEIAAAVDRYRELHCR